MANAVYPIFKAAILTAAANTRLDQDTVDDGPYVALVDLGTYAYDAAHDFYSDLSGIVGTDQRITAPTVAAATGLFDGVDVTFTAVSGATVEAIVIYRHNAGANTTWRLVLFEDTSVTGLPVTPNGGDISIAWNASGILQISDRHLKEDVVEDGDLFGVLPVYSFNYLGDPVRRRGLMAQDVERVAPSAVVDLGSFKAVNYRRAVECAAQLKEAA
jgi:hypothetical protein